MRLRSLLAMLIAGALLPVVAFAAIGIVRLTLAERAAVERRLLQSAKALGDSLDSEAAATARLLDVLGASLPRAGRDLGAFEADARRVLDTQPTWGGVVVSTASAETVLEVGALRAGGATRRCAEAAAAGGSGESRAVAVGDLVPLPGGAFAFPVCVPVEQGGAARWVLTALVSASSPAAVVAGRTGEDEWSRTIVDRAGVVVARSRAPDRFVGKPATPSFVRATGAADRGMFRDVTLDGEPVYVAFSHAGVSGWTTAVVVPRPVLEAATVRSLLATVGIGLASVVLGAGGALFVSRRFARAIGSATRGAQALAHGERPEVDAAGLREIADLSDALRRSADLLAARARERDEGLARAEAARAEAQQAASAKDEFLAILGHELRNPLSPIVTALYLLEQRGAASTREHAIIRRQVAHLLRLVEDLLDVSRITRGKVTLRMERVEVAAIVERAVETASHLLEEARHRLTVDVPPGLAVRGDPARLAQVVTNLLTNAARYTPPAGDVAVRARRVPAGVRIEVQDNGRGLAPELRERIFDAFVQDPRPRDRQEGGLGLGLALVKSLVALHGGRVEALSDGPGTGATFAVELPADSAAETAAPAAPRAAPRAPPAGALRVLLVDDNLDALALLADVVGRAGHDVRTAADGPAALMIAERFEPHVAVLDLGLPVMDGYELAAALKERLGERAPILVAVSGYGQPSDRERTRAMGFRCHLVKPAEPAALVEELERIAAERRAHLPQPA